MVVTMVSMRLPESETMKLVVPVAVRTAPVLAKPAPMQPSFHDTGESWRYPTRSSDQTTW
jgi:hypothetical protein